MSDRGWSYTGPIPKGHTYTAIGPEHQRCVHITFRIERPGGVDNLPAWLEVRMITEGSTWRGDVPIVFGSKNLLGSRTVTDIVKEFGRRMGAESFVTRAFDRVFSEIVYDVIRRQWEGPEGVDLAEVALPDQPRWLLRPWIESSTHTRLIAAGGTGKSYFALALAATVATGTSVIRANRPAVVGPVAYLDWEADSETHAERLRAVAAGADMPPVKGIHYFQMREKLARQSTSVATALHRAGCVMAVIDSNMLARGAAGERGGMEDSTVAMFEALRELGVPCLIIDHKSADVAKKGKKGGYGSVVNTNSVRLEWDIWQSVEVTNGFRWKASNTKANNIRKQPDENYEVRIRSGVGDRLEAVTFRPVEDIRVGSAAAVVVGEESLRERMVLVLREHGSLTNAEMAEMLGSTPEVVRTVRGREDRIGRVPGAYPARYELVDGSGNDPLPGNIA